MGTDTSKIEDGTLLTVTDARGEKHEAIAVSGVEPGDKFPIVWVIFSPAYPRERIPWPVEFVEVRDDA